MFEEAKEELSSANLEFLFVTREDVEYTRKSLESRYKTLSTIPGTSQFHYLAVEAGKKLLTKRYAYSENQQIFEVLRPVEEEFLASMEVDEEVEEHESPIVG